MKFYHITSQENVVSICENGLVPKIGDRGQSVLEDRKCVFVSDEESLPIWTVILGIDNPAVIVIDIPDEKSENYFTHSQTYGAVDARYNEFYTYSHIPAKYISCVYNEYNTEDELIEANGKMLLNLMFEMSITCMRAYNVFMRNIGNKNIDQFREELLPTWSLIKNLKPVSDKPKIFNMEYLEEFAEDLSECVPYTMFDTVQYPSNLKLKPGESYNNYYIYDVKNRRIWDILEDFVDPESQEIRSKIVNKLVDLGFDSFNVDTGGYFVDFNDMNLDDETFDAFF